MLQTFQFFLFFTLNFQTAFLHMNEKNSEWPADDPRWETKIPNWWDDSFISPDGPEEEISKNFWIKNGQNLLKEKTNQKLNLNRAKNVVIFIGDGMGLATLMATRSYINDVSTQLSFEIFPHTGLAKTYCVNYQVPDSSCTANAILSGIKSNYGTVGVTAEVKFKNCTSQRDSSTHTNSIIKYAQDAGKATGIVTTTRITHATPAAAYAHSSSRYWETNKHTPEGCDDIAYQLIHGEVGSKLDVVMGGGLKSFFNVSHGGFRTDGKNLLEEFKKINGARARIFKNKNDLLTFDSTKYDKVLGLFAPSHLEYKLLSKDLNQPTLTEMVEKSLEILRKNENGFVLLVEGGRIDTAHHDTTARLALDEVVEFQKAVQFVKDNTNEADTLILVTSDHSTVLTVGGYMPRGYNILGPGDYSRSDKMWFYTLTYANGPGQKDHVEADGRRKDPRGQKYMDPKFKQPAAVFDEYETHAGEDVGVYASGPFSHIFTGVYEQNFIAHGLMYASCLGPNDFLKNPKCSNSSSRLVTSIFLVLFLILFSAIFC